jgi:hypothetical protein
VVVAEMGSDDEANGWLRPPDIPLSETELRQSKYFRTLSPELQEEFLHQAREFAGGTYRLVDIARSTMGHSWRLVDLTRRLVRLTWALLGLSAALAVLTLILILRSF